MSRITIFFFNEKLRIQETDVRDTEIYIKQPCTLSTYKLLFKL